MSSLDHITEKDIILDSITDGVFTVDKEWRVTSFNHAAEMITGIPHEEAIGQPCRYVFRASICEGYCALRRTMETGRPITNFPIYIIRADGKRVPVSISTALLKDTEGNMIGGVETFRDLSEVEELKRELKGSYTFHDIISRSYKMKEIFDILPAIAQSPSTVLVEGESGTGKELICRAIHNLSPRKDRPFVAINCGALPDTLLESELFGYKAGAFTDARSDKPGRFAIADGGTILLDEIGDISPALQVRLLRLLQEKVYEPLGSIESVKADIRVLAATHSNLEELVEAHAFRRDLYYRINVVKITVPPLRERMDDIPLLVEHFIEHFNRLHHRDIEGVSDAAMACLINHDYPGNVRELENAIEHAFVMCRGVQILPEHLPAQLRKDSGEKQFYTKELLTLQAIEKNAITEALRHNNWNKAAAARELGIERSTLYHKIRKYRMSLPEMNDQH
ncbi:MAG TPA: sigma 54-interacting transcriptional regulator [Anaerolineae bacterium]|nr:sigma 54-interacting transcriptional regulator [Anaerolineae bacterium]